MKEQLNGIRNNLNDAINAIKDVFEEELKQQPQAEIGLILEILNDVADDLKNAKDIIY